MADKLVMALDGDHWWVEIKWCFVGVAAMARAAIGKQQILLCGQTRRCSSQLPCSHHVNPGVLVPVGVAMTFFPGYPYECQRVGYPGLALHQIRRVRDQPSINPLKGAMSCPGGDPLEWPPIWPLKPVFFFGRTEPTTGLGPHHSAGKCVS